jgi:hypothetical protein
MLMNERDVLLKQMAHDLVTLKNKVIYLERKLILEGEN